MPYPLAACRGRTPKPYVWTSGALQTVLGSSLLNWYEAVNGYLLDGSNANVTNGGIVTTWLDRRDTVGSQTHNTATASGSGLTWSSATKSVVFDGTNYLTLASQQVITALPATVYIIGLYPAGGQGIGGSTTASGFVTAGSDVSVRDDTGNGATTTGGAFVGGLMRFRRYDPGHFFIDVVATNVPSRNDSIGADFTFDLIGASRPSGSIVPTPNNSTIRAILTLAEDTIATGHDGAIRSYLTSTFGVSL